MTFSRRCSGRCRAGGHVRPGGDQSEPPGEVIGARFGSPLVVGLGEGEHLLASDPVAIAPHTARVAFSPGRRGRPPDRPRLRDPPPRARADHAADRPDRLEAGRRRAGRPRPLHDQGDSRAARDGRRRLPRPAAPGRGDGAVRRAEPLGPPAPPGSADRLRGLRDELARGPGGRVPDRAARPPAGRGRVRQRVPLPQRPAGRPDSRFRPQPVGRDGRHPGRSREAKRRGHPTLAIVNTVGSTIAREADGGIYLHAGPEVGVASTKAFSAQVTVLAAAGALSRPAEAALVLRRPGRHRCARVGARPDRRGAQERSR